LTRNDAGEPVAAASVSVIFGIRGFVYRLFRLGLGDEGWKKGL